MSRLQVRPEAEREAFEAALWYENERSGLGEEFLAALRETFNRIELSPRQFPGVSQALRRALLRRFPYGVYFALDADLATVVAILHLHRNPQIWKGRV